MVTRNAEPDQRRIKLTSLRGALETLEASVQMTPNGSIENAREVILEHLKGLRSRDRMVSPRYGQHDITERSEREIREIAAMRRGLGSIAKNNWRRDDLVEAVSILSGALYDAIATIRRTRRIEKHRIGSNRQPGDMESIMIRDAMRAVRNAAPRRETILPTGNG